MTDKVNLTFGVENLSCASCVGRVERALAAQSGVREAQVNLATESATVVVERPEDLVGISDALGALNYPVRTRSMTFDVSEMTCGGCVGRVERAVRAVPGVVTASANLATETLQVTMLERDGLEERVRDASTAAGYLATRPDGAESGVAQTPLAARSDALSRQVLLAVALTLPVFILEMGAHMIPWVHMTIERTIGTATSWAIQFVLTTLVLFGPGRTFFAKGLPALFRRAPDMNSLVAVGTGAAWGYSSVVLFAPIVLPDAVRAVYFEAAAVIVCLILIGRWMEARAKGRTGASIRALLDLQPTSARTDRDGSWIDVPISELAPQDRVLLRPGERVPTDGIVIEGSGYVDESMLTGEPTPAAKAANDPVTGGTVNGTGRIIFEVTRVGQDTTLAQIIRMVEEAQGGKLPIQGLVDRITLWFVPAVLLIACFTVALWLIFGPEPSMTFALVAGVSVLIIACPCAMGLATPTSIMVGTGRAAELGVLFRQGSALQGLSEVKVIAFDKTGTLTLGRPVLTDIETFDGFERTRIVELAGALEGASEHPIARAIVEAAAETEAARMPVMDMVTRPGAGVMGHVSDRSIAIGNARLMKENDVDISAGQERVRHFSRHGRTSFYVSVDGQLAAVFAVSDPVRPEARSVVASLHDMGYRVAMISGDAQTTAEAVGLELGIDTVVAGVLPDGKVAAIEQLKAGGTKAAFVGDGLNDAPALAAADIGVAIGSGTDVAIEAADVVLMTESLTGLLSAIEVSRTTMRNIRQNLGWAFGYNIALIPVAAGLFYPVFGVLLSPVFAAAAMAISSVSVLSNALRLRRIEG